MYLNPTTKKAQAYVQNYESTDPARDALEKCYKSVSNDKRRSFNDIWFEMKKNHGYGMRIISATCYFYSCAYKVPHDDGTETLVYHTHAHTYYIPII